MKSDLILQQFLESSNIEDESVIPYDVEVENEIENKSDEDIFELLKQILEILKRVLDKFEKVESLVESKNHKQVTENIDWSKIKWGSLTRWLKQHYGDAAFNKDGTIKKSFVRKLLNDPNISEKIKRKIRFYLYVLSK